MLRETRLNAGHLTMQQTKRSDTGGEIVTVSGYATVFNSLSRDLGWREVIDPQAFSQCDMSQCLALWMHSENALPLGRLTNGSLRLSIDRIGLRFAVDLDPQVTFHNDLMRLVKSQTIDQCSFAFWPASDAWYLASEYTGPGAEDLDPSDEDVRVITRIAALMDVSLVTTGAYASTSCEVLS